MLNGQLPDNPGTCATPLAQHKKIANEVNFNSTPIVLFDNGYVFNCNSVDRKFCKNIFKESQAQPLHEIQKRLF